MILALALYREIAKVPEEYDPRVLRIANLIDRSPDSVVYKVANLRFLETGGKRGLEHIGEMDRQVQREFAGKDEALILEAGRIRRKLSQTDVEEVEAEEGEGRGQGFNAHPEDRKRIEGVAMTQAVDYFSKQGYTVQDVHERRPYDLRCTKQREEFFVEVKGTTGSGKKILLTAGEVKFAKKHLGRMALFVTHSINLANEHDLDNGTRIVLLPWEIDDRRLIPSTYVCELR